MAILYVVFACLLLVQVARLGAQWHWLLDLTTHFPLQFACLAGIFTLIFYRKKRRALMGLALITSLWNLWLVLPAYIGPPAVATQAAEGSESIRLLSFNVFQMNTEHDKVREFIEGSGVDIVALQEFSGEWSDQLQSLKAKYPHWYTRPAGHGNGIGLMSRLPIKRARAWMPPQTWRTVVHVILELGGQEVNLVVIHPDAPMLGPYADNRNRLFAEVAKYVADLQGPVVIMGDFNCTPWSPWFHELLDQTGLRDSRRGFGYHSSWPKRMPLLGIPIDHFLVSEDWVVHNREVGPYLGSDHRPIILTASVPEVS